MSILQSVARGVLAAVNDPRSKREMAASLDTMAREHKEKLDWRHSIVDLMKLLGMDASVESRDELALELGYTGPLNGSAGMNRFMHDKLMQKIRET